MTDVSDVIECAQITSRRISVWNEERIDLLKQLHAKGLSYRQIACEMPGISRNAAIGKGHRLGLRCDPNSKRPPAPRISSHTKPAARLPKKLVSATNGTNSMRVFKKITAQAFKLRCVEIVPLNLSLHEIPDNGCRFIEGDDHLCCGHPKQEGSSYCTPHHYLTHQVAA